MKIIKKIVIILIIIVVALASFIIGRGYSMYKSAIEKVPLSEKVESIKSQKNYTKYEELPKMYINSVIAVEDHRFYDHGAIDIISIGRAIYTDIKEMELIEGGSTITQQLAKNIYFTQEKSILRKVAEIFMAFEIEKNYNKEEIFEMYVNTSYFGDGYYCVRDASKGYFGKEPKDMTDYEATLLAGIPNAPSVYSPTKNPDLASQRQKQVIDKLVKYEYITEEKGKEIENNKS